LGTMEFARIAGAKVIAMDIQDSRLSFCRDKLNIPHTVNARGDVMAELSRITDGDMPTVIIDATGNLRAITTAFQYLAHGGRYVLVGLQKENISFNHPEFHKRESTLMSSRNATRADFDQVISSMNRKLVDPATYITHQTGFDEAKYVFKNFLNPNELVIKAMISF
ncbi:MAG: alcohol dehydrogenase, partial [Sphingobacteriales bacterium]